MNLKATEEPTSGRASIYLRVHQGFRDVFHAVLEEHTYPTADPEVLKVRTTFKKLFESFQNESQAPWERSM